MRRVRRRRLLTFIARCVGFVSIARVRGVPWRRERESWRACRRGRPPGRARAGSAERRRGRSSVTYRLCVGVGGVGPLYPLFCVVSKQNPEKFARDSARQTSPALTTTRDGHPRHARKAPAHQAHGGLRHRGRRGRRRRRIDRRRPRDGVRRWSRRAGRRGVPFAGVHHPALRRDPPIRELAGVRRRRAIRGRHSRGAYAPALSQPLDPRGVCKNPFKNQPRSQTSRLASSPRRAPSLTSPPRLPAPTSTSRSPRSCTTCAWAASRHRSPRPRPR